MKAFSLNTVRGLLGLLSVFLCSSAWAIYERARDLSKEDEECWVFAKTPTVTWYDTINEKNPRAAPKDQPDPEPDHGVNNTPPDYHLPAKECAQFMAAKPDGLFNISQRRSWYRKSDFITFDQLQRVDRWTTRYTYRRTALSGAGAELGINPNMISLGEEIFAYRASAIREGLFIFTPDAHWIDTERKLRWEIRLTPTGRLALIDPSGQYLPVVNPVFHREYPNKCATDLQGKLVCGLAWHDQMCEGIEKRNNPKEQISESCRKEIRQKNEESFGRLILMYGQPESHHPGIEFKPESVVISRRFVLSRRDVNQRYLSFYSRFEDPIRPVFLLPELCSATRPLPMRVSLAQAS